MADITLLFTRLNEVKKEMEEWKNALPSYYEPIKVPIQAPQAPEERSLYEKYPYDSRLDYVTGRRVWHCLLILGFCGHTMNLYRAALLRVDRHLLGHMFPAAKPSQAEIEFLHT